MAGDDEHGTSAAGLCGGLDVAEAQTFLPNLGGILGAGFCEIGEAVPGLVAVALDVVGDAVAELEGGGASGVPGGDLPEAIPLRAAGGESGATVAALFYGEKQEG